jgi:peptide/nickel transport system permease protein
MPARQEAGQMQRGELSDVEAVLGGTVAYAAVEEEQALAAARRRSTWARMQRQRVALASLVVIVLFVLAAILTPWLAPHDPNFQYDSGLSAAGAPLGSTAQFPLGADTAGRDVLSRLLFGARISLTVGVLATALMATVGVALGAIAGFYGGWAAVVIMRLVDIMT